MSLTSSELAEKLNDRRLGKGIFFMPAVDHHVIRLRISNKEVLAHTNHVGMAIAQLQFGVAVTGFLYSIPACVFGFVPIWKGVAESWMLVDDMARERPLAMTKGGKMAHDIAKISLGLHRQQITVRIDDKRAYKWALALGFREEALMRHYGPDMSDYFLMARF